MAEMSVIAAIREFFGTGRFGRKVEIPEFKELNDKDKQDLREMLIGQGYDIPPIPEKVEKREPYGS